MDGDNGLTGLGHGHGGVALDELHNMDGSLNGGLSVDGLNGTLNSLMESPPHAVYTALEDLLIQANNFATARGYKLVVVRSKTNPDGQKTWVHLACDRHGVKRNTHNLTPETRKKNRRSRRCECPMYALAIKTTTDLWELVVKNPSHNHGPYEAPPKRRRDMMPPPPSETVNLPSLQTPSACIADFCLVPIGTGNASVSAEIAEVQRLLKRSGLVFSMSSAGTTVEGPWDDVMRIIGQAHSLLHASGVVRIQTDIRVGSRTDKTQTIEDKIAVVQALLNGQNSDGEDIDGEELAMDEPHLGQLQEAMSAMHHSMNGSIQPGLEHLMPQSQYASVPSGSMPMHPMSQQDFSAALPPHMQHHMQNGMGSGMGPGMGPMQ